MAQLLYNSPIGPILIKGTEQAISSVTFSEGQPEAESKTKVPALLHQAAQQLTEYFCGTRKTFDLPLSPAGTHFQQLVWQSVAKIPLGQTRSYKQIADGLALPGGSRAVGMANAHNPFLVVVPCHRVIGTSGVLSGYAGGILRKRWLLQHEGQAVQLPLFANSQ